MLTLLGGMSSMFVVHPLRSDNVTRIIFLFSSISVGSIEIGAMLVTYMILQTEIKIWEFQLKMFRN